MLVNGKHPVRSVNAFLVPGSSRAVTANTEFLVSSLEGEKYVSSLSSKSSLFVDLLFFRLWYKCPKLVVSNFGICLEISLAVRPGHVAKFPFFYGLD